MWTPRRILMLLFGLAGFLAAYAGYARIMGGVDGLPQLPPKLLVRELGVAHVKTEDVSATDQRLIEAFGPNCAERNYSAYPTKIEMREDGIVFAAGRPQFENEKPRYVTLSPFSVAVFGKPRPPHERAPGEVTEITTIHSDKAILEFDRPVGNEKDMLGGKAKLVGVELRSDPTQFSTDTRNGRVNIVNNQKSGDPNRALVFKTPGPVFYRVAGHDGATPAPAAPDIWTTAVVHVENRENMPRPLRGAGLPAVPVGGVGGPTPETNVVAEMILGAHTPPPTITADGMKIYLKPPPPPPPGPAAQAKRRGPSFGGVRLIELSENVLMNLWVDGKSGFPGAGGPDAAPADPKGPPAPPTPADPPLGVAAVGGGLADAATLAARLGEKALVRIRTLGAFRYDYESNAARFEIAPRPPNDPLSNSNHVEVTRLSALGPRDFLVCQLLELELDRPLTHGGTGGPAPPEKGKAAGPAFKAVRATGPHVYISAEAEQFTAQGTSLVYRTGLTDPKDPRQTYTRTELLGAPLLAVRDRTHMLAGRKDLPGVFTMTTADPLPGSKEPKQSRATVRGPGQVDIYDAATNDITLRATWTEALDHVKDRVGGKELDLLVFLGAGTFEDPKGTFDLSGDTLKLWLEGGAKPAGPDNPKGGGQPLPFRLQAIGHVHGKSTDAVYKDIDHLNVWFNDAPPPPAAVAAGATAPPAAPLTALNPAATPVAVAAPPAGPPPPGGPVPPAAAAPPVVAAAPPPPLLDPLQPAAAPPKPNPIHLSAAAVEAWVARYPQPKGDRPKAPAGQPGGDGVRYELDRARCDGRVVVHQEPADPAKSPRGTDIAAAVLHLHHFPTGHAMTAVGTDQAFAEVHFENVSIAGPHVVIDQPKNLVEVTGKGWLRMPSGSDLGGQELNKPADLTVVWQDRMRFNGERQGAEFIGGVQAEQRTEQAARADGPPADPAWGRSLAVCHRMEVTFDRPVYFNQLRPTGERPAAGGKGAAGGDSAKIEGVVCSPAPEDGEAGRPRVAAAPVVFFEETVSARTGKHVKAHWIKAKVLEVKAADTRTLVTASGPGETRLLQIGSKDPAGRPPPAAAAGPDGTQTRTALKPAEEEMKLTVVKFAGNLRIDDRKGIFQQAVYREAVRVFHIPSENLWEAIEEHAVPARSVVLRCTDTLTVSAYKGKNGAEDERRMEAVGGAKVQDDAYVGNGHTVVYDGATVTLSGYKDDQATLRRRQRAAEYRQDYKSGREIRYDTRTGQVTVVDSSGGQFSDFK